MQACHKRILWLIIAAGPMKMDKRSLASNTFSLILMHAASMAIMFVLTVIIARSLGESLFGLYTFAVALTGLSGVIVHFGLERYMTRTISRDPKIERKVLSNCLGIKIPLFAVMLFLTLSYLYLMGYPSDTVVIVLIFAVYTALASYGKVFRAVFQAHNRMDLEAGAETISRILLFFAVVAALNFQPTVWSLAIAFCAFSAFDVALSAFFCGRHFTLCPPAFELSKWKAILSAASPFFLTSALMMVMFRLDIVMLSIYRPDHVVGWYGAAYKIIEGLLVVPTAAVVAAYPVLSHSYKADEKNFIRQFKGLFAALSLSAVVFSAFIYVFSEKIIHLVFGPGFEGAVPALRVLSAVSLIMYVRYLMSTSLDATDGEQTNLGIAALAALTNVFLNLMLIPRFGHIGAAWATLATEIAYLGLSAYAVYVTLKKLKPKL